MLDERFNWKRVSRRWQDHDLFIVEKLTDNKTGRIMAQLWQYDDGSYSLTTFAYEENGFAYEDEYIGSYEELKNKANELFCSVISI